MRKALDEFIEYQKEVDERINKFAEEVEAKKNKVNELENEFAASIIGGNKVDSKKLDKAKKELDDSVHQLGLIKEARLTDEKLTVKADAVYKEYYKAKNHNSVKQGKINNEIGELKKKLEAKEEEVKRIKSSSNQILRREAKERMNALEYMTLSDAEKNQFVSMATGFTYNQYKQKLKA